MAWHIDRQQDCLPDVQWRRGRLVSWPQHGRHCMATVCACGGTRWMECRCEVWESATSYGDERQCVSSYYQYACVQCAVAAAEHLQGRAWPVFLILLLGGSTCTCCTAIYVWYRPDPATAPRVGPLHFVFLCYLSDSLCRYFVVISGAFSTNKILTQYYEYTVRPHFILTPQLLTLCGVRNSMRNSFLLCRCTCTAV